MASAVAAANDEIGLRSRTTQDGRTITYKLKVVQQPERARACGQGAKASSDRRPVDPPPIVELHILEGEDGAQRDITFGHNASYFLFATLENARPIAQPRGSQSQQGSTGPVLTGTPVAGMAYLERPSQAGYFIFPDLSVRHEGRYRLVFNLFETLKDPRDADTDTTEQELVNANGIGGHVHGRCEVKSSPFTVYSAKKFPGLAESTSLSRTVADQGCRVRIRRDVRMRRRDNKFEKDVDDGDEEIDAVSGAVEDQVAQHPAVEPADLSTATAAHQTEMHPPPPATTQSYQPPQPAFDAHYQQQSSQFMTPTPLAQQFPQHSYMYQQQPPAHSQYSYMPPPLQMQEQYTQYAPPPPSSNFQQYSMNSAYPSQSAPLEYGRPPPPPPPFQVQTYHPNSTQTGSQLPPLKTLENTQTKMENTSPISSHGPTRQSSYEFKSMPPPPSVFVNAGGPAPKRSFGAVFNTEHINQSLRGGARPDSNLMHSPLTSSSDGSEDDDDLEMLKMTYRRANGQVAHCSWPM